MSPVTWQFRCAAFSLIVGILLSPLGAMAVTVPVLAATVVAVEPSAATQLARPGAVRREAERPLIIGYDAALFEYGEPSNLHVAAGAGAIPTYDDDDVEDVDRREIRGEGAICVGHATSTAAEGGGLLAASELAGGHALALHAALDAAALDARLAAEATLKLASSFASQAEAETAAAGVLGQNAAAVEAWTQAGAVGRLPVSGPFSGGLIRVVGGYSAEATGATFVLQGNGAGGYFILTGFPIP